MVVSELLYCLRVVHVSLKIALCFVLLKQNKLIIPCFVIISLKLSSLAENFGNIKSAHPQICTHPHGPKIK